MIILATIFSGLSLLMSILLVVKLKSPLGVMVWFPKLIAGALSPILTIMGAAGALIGWGYGALWALPMGIIGAGVMLWYVWRSARDHTGFEEAFGAGWKLMHIALFGIPIVHAENLGGDIDLLLNQRVTIGCYPWRFVNGESSICRIVAFVDPDEYKELMKKKEAMKLTPLGDIIP